MKNAQNMMCDAHGEGSMCTKNHLQIKTDHQSLGTMISLQNLYRFPTLLNSIVKIYDIGLHLKMSLSLITFGIDA